MGSTLRTTWHYLILPCVHPGTTWFYTAYILVLPSTTRLLPLLPWYYPSRRWFGGFYTARASSNDELILRTVALLFVLQVPQPVLAPAALELP